MFLCAECTPDDYDAEVAAKIPQAKCIFCVCHQAIMEDECPPAPRKPCRTEIRLLGTPRRLFADNELNGEGTREDPIVIV